MQRKNGKASQYRHLLHYLITFCRTKQTLVITLFSNWFFFFQTTCNFCCVHIYQNWHCLSFCFICVLLSLYNTACVQVLLNNKTSALQQSSSYIRTHPDFSSLPVVVTLQLWHCTVNHKGMDTIPSHSSYVSMGIKCKKYPCAWIWVHIKEPQVAWNNSVFTTTACLILYNGFGM